MEIPPCRECAITQMAKRCGFTWFNLTFSEHITKGLVVSFLAPLTPAAPPSSWARWPRPLETSSSRLLAVSR